MTISSTLSSALSGLQAAAKSAELISSNVAYAMTEGYGRRELELTARRVGDSGQGVRAIGVIRLTDPALTSDRRMAGADLAFAEGRATFHADLLAVLGKAEEPGSLTARMAGFDAALIAAAANPGSDAHLAQVLDAAHGLTDSLGRAGRAVQDARTAADRQIAADVQTINQTLAQIAGLNTDIRGHAGTGRDASALMDQRDQLIDRLSGLVPLRVVDRDHGQIAIYSGSGAVLLDGRPSVLEFTPAALVTAEMTTATGGLSGLRLNGVDMTPGQSGSLLNGGKLGAAFDVRDRLGPEAQARVDAIARDLVERFADPAVDPSLLPGDAGLFTDSGLAFDPLNEEGLAQRLSVNPLADPAQGGALWRLRDGIGAVAPGPPGDTTLLQALRTALNTPRAAASGDLGAGAVSALRLSGEFLSRQSVAFGQAEDGVAFSVARHGGLRALELEQGVDTDHELQNLIMVEKAYAANARVIQTVDEMLNQLLGL